MARQKIAARVIASLLVVVVSTSSLARAVVAKTTVNIGGLFPLKTAADRSTSGRQNLAAVMLAIDQLNDKNDGINDNLLTNFTVRIVLLAYCLICALFFVFVVVFFVVVVFGFFQYLCPGLNNSIGA